MVQEIVSVNDPKILLQQLRDATRSSHTRLEQTALSARLTSPGVTVQHYAMYLAYMQPVVQWFAENIDPVVAYLVPDIAEREKLGAINADLEALHSVSNVEAVPAFAPHIPSADVAFSLGMMYVMEGSTLGGQVIQRHLRAHLPLSAVDIYRYFNGYGEHTGRKWKEFLNVLTDYAVQNNCMPAIIAGSIYAFDTIEDHFSAAI